MINQDFTQFSHYFITLLELYFSPAYSCPKGEVYMAKGPVPAPTCLEKNATQTGTARGCFCPEGQFLQDGQCVQDDKCRCIHEGIFYDVSQIISFTTILHQCDLSKSWIKRFNKISKTVIPLWPNVCEVASWRKIFLQELLGSWFLVSIFFC